MKERRPDSELSPFGRVVRRIREERGLSQAKVAEQGGFSPGGIGNIERGLGGVRPSRDTVLNYAKGLSATAAETAELLEAAGYDDAGTVTKAPNASRPSFRDVVNADPSLRSDHKRILIAMYDALSGSRG